MRILCKAQLLAVTMASIAGHSVAGTANNAWTEWPASREDYEPRCEVPPGFLLVDSLVTSTERMSLNGRFRSDDRSVEFGVAAMYVRDLPPTLEARAIPLPLFKGERVVKREPLRRNVNVHGSTFEHYEESITVEGPKSAYTRYFLIEISTGALPGAFSLLWEFKVTDEKARRAFQQTYKNFKDRVSLGED